MKKLLLLFILLISINFCFAQQNNITAKSAEEAGIFCKPTPSITTKASVLDEGFEGGVVPPTGWTETTTTSYNWEISTSFHSGTNGAEVEYDPGLNAQDEELITPVIDLSSATSSTLTFWFSMSEYWGIQQNDNYDLNVYVSIDGGTTWSSSVFTETDVIDTTTYNNWDWIQATVDMSAYLGNANCKISFEYTGTDGASLYLDDIVLDVVTGVAEHSNNEIKIYPSPAKDVLNINYNNMSKIDVYNVVGQKVFSKEVTSDNIAINTSSFPNGTYVLKISTIDKGIISKKFIVFK